MAGIRRFIAALAILIGSGAPLLAQPSTQLISSPPLVQLGVVDARSEAATEFLAARLLAARGAFQAALEAYARAHELVPEDPWPDLERARLLLRLRDVSSATQLAEEVVLRAPDLLEAYELVAEARMMAIDTDPRAAPAAEVALRKLVELSDYQPHHALNLAQVLQAQGRLAEAIETLSIAASRSPNARLQSILVRMMLEAGREADAEQALRELLALAPGALEERLLLVEILSQRNDHGGAAAVLAAAPELGSEARLTRRLAWEQAQAGMVPEALATIARLLEEGSADARLRILQADLLSRSGQPGEAESVLQAALLLEPPSGDVALALAAALERRGESGAAAGVLETTARRLVAANDEEGADDLLVRLAGRRLDGGSPADALAVLETLSDPERGLEVALDALLARQDWTSVLARAGASFEVAPGIEARRAEALFRLDRIEEAEAAIARLVADGSVINLRLAVVVHQRLGRHQASLPLLEQLEAREPQSLEIPFRRGAALERLGRIDEASLVFRALVERAPDFDQALNYLGYMLAEHRRDLPEALEFIERAVLLRPDSGAYRDSLGWVLFQLGRHREARAELETAARLSPGEPTILDHLGDVLAALGESQPALEAWAQALEHGIEDPVAVQRKIDAARGGG